MHAGTRTHLSAWPPEVVETPTNNLSLNIVTTYCCAKKKSV